MEDTTKVAGRTSRPRWEHEVNVGRVLYHTVPRYSSTHWLISRISKEMHHRHVFSRFKAFADFDAGIADGDAARTDPPGIGVLP